MITLDKLHDATLSDIELSWRTGELKLHIQGCIDGKKDTHITITAEGLTFLSVPRYCPWGKSNSINKAWQEQSGEANKLVIQMQSGDLIEARVNSFTLQSGQP